MQRCHIYIYSHILQNYVYIFVYVIPLGCAWAHLCHDMYVRVRVQLVGARSFLLPFGDKWSGLVVNTFTHRAISIALFLLLLVEGGCLVVLRGGTEWFFCVNMIQAVESSEEGFSAEEIPS